MARKNKEQDILLSIRIYTSDLVGYNKRHNYIDIPCKKSLDTFEFNIVRIWRRHKKLLRQVIPAYYGLEGEFGYYHHFITEDNKRIAANFKIDNKYLDKVYIVHKVNGVIEEFSLKDRLLLYNMNEMYQRYSDNKILYSFYFNNNLIELYRYKYSEEENINVTLAFLNKVNLWGTL